MAAKKKTAKISADRAEGLKKTEVRAGKSKAIAFVRAKQNAGVKDGTIKIGASGKSYNIWDAKTSSWKRGVVAGAKTSNTETSKPKKYGVSDRITDRNAKPLPHKQGINTTLGSEGPKPKITKRYATKVSPSKRGEGSGKSGMKYGNR